jgi:hypothetical protein
MLSSSGFSSAKEAYHATVRFAFRVVLLTIGFIAIVAAALTLDLFGAYLASLGLPVVASALKVLSYGLLIFAAIWFVGLTLSQGWRFFKDVNEMHHG